MPAPVKQTCPDIDRAIRHLKDALSECKDLTEDRKQLQSIEWEIESAIGYFEDLRKANHLLREWGEETESERDKLEEKIELMEYEKEEALLKTGT